MPRGPTHRWRQRAQGIRRSSCVGISWKSGSVIAAAPPRCRRATGRMPRWSFSSLGSAQKKGKVMGIFHAAALVRPTSYASSAPSGNGRCSALAFVLRPAHPNVRSSSVVGITGIALQVIDCDLARRPVCDQARWRSLGFPEASRANRVGKAVSRHGGILQLVHRPARLSRAMPGARCELRCGIDGRWGTVLGHEVGCVCRSAGGSDHDYHALTHQPQRHVGVEAMRLLDEVSARHRGNA